MKQYDRDLSNLSYTNKDFNQIYTELLDLVKKISYKWDPSASDESDPGVVLLKLAALMTDKSNYNIDKNILELFPLSVTQQNAARELFDQCGYAMKYYRSANTILSLTMVPGCEPDWSDDGFSEDTIAEFTGTTDADVNWNTAIRYYKIPKYTMISNSDNSIVYTTIADVTLGSDGITQTVNARQGVINTYTVNDDTNITAANLDYNNRLYFTELDIAENGIFIEDESKHEWKQVDNLVLQPYGTYCYKFGLNDSGTMCYIEFPEDIDSLIGQGITIKYLRSQGKEGNIAANSLKQLYADVTAARYLEGYETVISDCTVATYQSADSGNVYVTNKFAAIDGENPESIDSAYRNYQKIKTTFETLVSLRDYENFLFSNENVSNSFVCDRTNDLQCTYKIINNDGTNSTTVVNVSKDTSSGGSTPEMTAFDLKIYGLEYVSDFSTSDRFNKSFTIINYTDASDTQTAWTEILADTDNVKSLQHNYKAFKKNTLLMLMNKYPIVAKIIPTSKLEVRQQIEVQTAIIRNLYDVLNARAIDFGDPVEYDLVYDTIINSDPRIRAITLNDITYETWAQYIDDSNKVCEIRIDNLSVMPDLLDKETFDAANPIQANSNTPRQLWLRFRRDIYAKSVLAGKTQLLAPDDRFTYSLTHKDASLITNAYRITTNTDIILNRVINSNPPQYSSSQLKTNENLVFTAPNYVDDVPYSSYVKFIHNIKLPAGGRLGSDSTDTSVIIKSNDVYKLAEGEYIMFFWKSEDDDNAPYQYQKYDSKSAINIITPTFSMLQQREPDSSIGNIPEKTIANIKAGRGNTDAVLTAGDCGNLSFTQYISKLITSDFVLSGTDTITTKKPNSISINSATNKIFWFLNNESNGRCVLFAAGDDRQYTLQDGEYLVYSNATGTQLNLLGSGTIITRSSTNETQNWVTEWSCVAGDYDEFLANDIEYFSDKWFTIPTGTIVQVTETQYYQLGPNNSVRIEYTGNETEEFSKLIINNSGVCGFAAVGDTTGKEVSLGNYNIFYTDEEGVETRLPTHNTGVTEDGIDTSWQAHSILNIKASPTQSQTLDSNQYLLVYTDPSNISDEKAIRIPKLRDGVAIDGCSIYADREVSYTGGELVDTTSLDIMSGAVIPLQLYSYHTTSSEADSVTGDWNFGTSTTQLQLSNTSGQDVATMPFTLPVGDYVLPLTVSDTLDSLELSIIDTTDILASSTIVTTMGGLTTYQHAGKYYLKISLINEADPVNTPGIAKYMLMIKYALSSEKQAKLTFDNLYKYTVPNITNVDETRPEYKIADFTLDDIAQLIDQQLDTAKLFNYTYQVPDEELIVNPLTSASFVDSNHIYNPFTICRWDNTNENTNELNVINRVK